MVEGGKSAANFAGREGLAIVAAAGAKVAGRQTLNSNLGRIDRRDAAWAALRP